MSGQSSNDGKDNKDTKDDKNPKDEPPLKPTKRRVNPIRLSNINAGLQIAFELQAFRYPPPTPSALSMNMSVTHNGNQIFDRSFSPGQDRRFYDALESCDEEAQAWEADHGMLEPGTVTRRTHIRRPVLPSRHNIHRRQPTSGPRVSSSRAAAGTRSRSNMMHSSLTMSTPNPREIPLDQYSNYMQQIFGDVNTSAPTGILEMSNPNNISMEGPHRPINPTFLIPEMSNWIQSTQPYKHSQSSSSSLNQRAHERFPNSRQPNRGFIASGSHPSSSSRRNEQPRSQSYRQSQTGFRVAPDYNPSNEVPYPIYPNTRPPDVFVGIGTHNSYLPASGSAPALPPPQMQSDYSSLHPDAVIPSHQPRFDASWQRRETTTHASDDSSPSSFSSNSTGQSHLQSYNPGSAFYSDELNPMQNNANAPETTFFGNRDFSASRSVQSSSNGFVPTMGIIPQSSPMPSPLSSLSHLQQPGGFSGPSLLFPSEMSPEEMFASYSFDNIGANDRSLLDRHWTQ